ncbi:kinesin-domain-containing protein [Martensiomyces pterosporus]|nr:kinesin-domain-containing protein [Martensiomyces pterosporus]
MARHHPDLIFCRRLPGIAIGRLCEKCDGKCVICDSLVRPAKLVHICDECNYGSYKGRCIVCDGRGISDAYYCKECVGLEKDRDGCPKITTGIRPPGSLLKQPSKIGGLKPPTDLSRTVGSGISGKRKAPGDAQELSIRPPSAAGAGAARNITTRPVKAPVSRTSKQEVETVHAGRRSSQGFKVTPKQARSPAPHAGAKPPAMAAVAAGASSKAGAVSRVASRNSTKPTALGRVPAARTSVTHGRANAGRAATNKNAHARNMPPPDSVKRRKVDASVRSRGAAPPSFNSRSAGAGNQPAKGSAAGLQAANGSSLLRNGAQAAGNGDAEEDEDDDEDEEDEELGPPPMLHKRSEYDYNGRLKDLEAFSEYMIMKNRTTRKKKKLLSVELEHHSTQMSQLEFDKQILGAKVDESEKQIKSLKGAIDQGALQLQEQKRRHEDEVDDMNRKFKREAERMQDEQRVLGKTIAELNATLDETKTSLQSKKDECVRLDATISKQASDQLELESSYRNLKAKLENLEDVVNEREIRIAELEESVAARNHTIDELEAKLRKEETMRRQLHNTIQELKGNIRVFCRVRPLLGKEKEMAEALPISFPECDNSDEIELVQSSESAMGKATSKTFPFKFDRVFASDSTQDAVFDEVSQLIQSALDGYPVCIFAYGQTGSGKTHTMQGPDSISSADMSEAVLGIIPRSVKQIYENTSKLAERGWEYTLEGQFLEIYNETLQDLLAPSGRTSPGGDKQPTKLDIYQDSEGHTRVKNVTTVKVDSAERVHWLLARAADNRTVAATNCNERSSRSHSVFTLHLHGRNSLTGESSSGVLNLIDLAGSERLSSSGSRGERLKETQAINKSLACLGDVIAALAKGSRHVPYRNSKLTHLLQESLGAGNSKTLMFVCVNPSPSSTQESLCSLQFATKVNSCQIGTARRQASA